MSGAVPEGLAILVSVGTDVHHFDRLVGWADRWAQEHPEDRVTVQYGTSSPPMTAGGSELFGRAEMLARLAESDVVILSCGPGAVMDARGAGRFPIVVPRRPDLDEHVDGHQLTFARHLDLHGMAIMSEDEATFRELLDRARREPEAFRVALDAEEPPGVARLGSLIDDLLRSP